jgi:lipopolysaccharide export system protein LptA
MRKFLPILLTLIVLVGIFIAYFGLQPKLGDLTGGGKKADKFAPVNDDKNAFIKAGTGAWVKQYDAKGQLYYQFKSDYYDPQPDGTVKVTHPVIQFFLSNSQVLQIEGVDGDIRFAPGADKGVMSNSPTDPPRYGNLRDVHVKIFSSPAEQAANAADMTMTMTNAQFDNDTYSLFTQEYSGADGKIVHADEVPVTVNAKDFAFTGSGLLMYWNDVDKQLKSLEIAHGTDLTVYNASAFSTQGAPVATQPVVAPVATAVVVPTPMPQGAASPPSPPPPDGTRHRYMATFYDHVRVLQAGQELIRADRMDADFMTKSGGGSTEDNSPPPVAPTETAPVTPTTESVSRPTPAPAASEPMHIHWTGKMVMVPTDEATAPALPDGKAIIHFAGTPVLLHQAGADSQQWVDARCADLNYHTADSSAVLAGDVELKQTKAGVVSSVTGQSLNFSRATHLATFDGPGRIRLPDPNDEKSVMTADYGRSCRVHFFDADSSQMEIERADLAGNVVVDHPRFHLTASDDVGLQFDAADRTADQKSSSPPLRRITAIGNADCIVHEANQKDRRIAGRQLQLLRDPGPDGKLYARTIICDGSVQAVQDDQTLTAEHLQIGLLPAPAKAGSKADEAVALDKLIANTNVVITGKDSSSASADALYVEMRDGHAHVTLFGSPSHDAVVKNKTSTMTGPMIHLSPHDQTASIDGPGTFEGLSQPKDPRQKPRPLKLTWLQKATLDGNANQVLVIGGVVATSNDPNGSHDSAKCDHILATLVDVPPAKTTGAPAANKQSDSSAYGADGDFLKDKQIDVLSLRMDEASPSPTTRPEAQVQSYLTDAGGYLLRQFNLLSHRIDYDVPSKRLIVPGPGEIFAREQAPRGAATQGAASGADSGSGIGGHGTTAIQWQKRFIYDDAGHTAVIDGSVTIVHWTDGKKPEQIRLDNANIVQAEFAGSGGNAGPVNSGDVDDSQDRQLKSLTATGKMIIRTTDKTIYCGELDFDPGQQTLTCRGGDLGKVTIVDDNNLAGGTCAQAIFNLKTNELKKMTDVTGQMR